MTQPLQINLTGRTALVTGASSGLGARFAKVLSAQGARVVVRWLRGLTDFDYEFQLAGMNSRLMPEIETVFMTPTDEYRHVSATLVREIATLGGDVAQFVSPVVFRHLQAKIAERARQA